MCGLAEGRKMKRWTTLLAVLAFLVAGASVAQTASESKTKEKGAHGTMTTKAKMVTGTVKEYDAGKDIEIAGPGGKTYKFDLDKDARVEGSIAVGQTVKAEYTKDSAGKDHV